MFDREALEVALDAIDHRGRDYRGTGQWAGVRLGHNRLAIQDLSSAGNQPCVFNGGALVFNGELWRRSFEGYGSLNLLGGNPLDGDTQLLARMCERYGENPWDVARRLDGMFAYVVVDEARGQVVLARDWLGRIPLYYVLGPDCIAFASEAKALVTALGVGFAGNASRAQAKSEIKLFPPGHVAVYSLKDGSWVCQPFRGYEDYEGPDTDILDDRGIEYYTKGLRERLEAAVDNESVADVPICTILSGGVDSTIVTAILAKLRPDVRAYTVSVGDSVGKDDLLFARLAAASIGVDLVEVIVSREEVEAGLRDAVWAVEDARWVQVAPAVPQMALARRIGADGYKVVFGGEGADELFASYNDVKRWSWRPDQYRERRLDLCQRLHDNNLIRGNKAMMWGGTVELRTPFLDQEVVDWCLRIPARYRADRDGAGRHVKYVLREAFRGRIPDELLWRPKVAFQDGAHSDFLKGRKADMQTMFDAMFGNKMTRVGGRR